jgi:prolyl oligopeptidase PreP (S9A serine peptidase family)
VIYSERSPIVTALLTNNTLFTLEEKQGKGMVKAWSTEGQLQGKYPLPTALQSLDLHHYSESNSLLVRQMDPISGIRYLLINPAYTQAIEIVNESLDQTKLPPIESHWQYINSYDGTPISVLLIKPKDIPRPRSAPSLFLPMPEYSDDLLRFQPDLAISQQILRQGGICVFVFPRGSRRLGRAAYQQGTGPHLQLAYDDLQATLAYCNLHQIGAADRRMIWATGEQSLSGAVLSVQRPDLADAIYLSQVQYDLREDKQRANPFFFTFLVVFAG